VHGFYSINAYSAIMTRGERVIAVSDSIRDYILKNYPKVSADHIRVVPRGVKLDWTWSDGVLKTTVPSLQVYDVLVVRG